jgi:hypothetical protein
MNTERHCQLLAQAARFNGEADRCAYAACEHALLDDSSL